jgi:hypothetical protein
MPFFIVRPPSPGAEDFGREPVPAPLSALEEHAARERQARAQLVTASVLAVESTSQLVRLCARDEQPELPLPPRLVCHTPYPSPQGSFFDGFREHVAAVAAEVDVLADTLSCLRTELQQPVVVASRLSSSSLQGAGPPAEPRRLPRQHA